LIALVLSRAGSSSFAVGAVTAASLIAVILLGPFYPAATRRQRLHEVHSWSPSAAMAAG